MQCSTAMFTAFWIVSSIQVAEQLERSKRQEDSPWNWGVVDSTQPNVRVLNENQPSTEEPATTTEKDLCKYEKLKLPDFSAPGRRISETKCYEHIWQIKYREDWNEKGKLCFDYINRKGAKFSIGGAIGGRNALKGEFPHMAALGWKASAGTWVFKCGGSLISSKFVLTAAHCTQASPLDTTITGIFPKIVRMGDRNIIDTWHNGYYPEDINITRIIVHPQHVSPKKYFDIALLEVVEINKYSNILNPACLWTSSDTSSLGTEATLTGWGVIETTGRKTSPILQAAVVDIIDTKTCDRLLRPSCNRNWCGVQDHQICAGKLAGGVDACQGDSGGPLQVKIALPVSKQGSMYYVIGVTSFGIRCALADTPGVYTRVSSFIDWIEDIVWPQGNNSTTTAR